MNISVKYSTLIQVTNICSKPAAGVEAKLVAKETEMPL